MTFWFPSQNKDVGKHWLTGDKALHDFRLQFHDEGGLRVYRQNGRGAPYAVSARDEERAVAKYQRGKMLVMTIFLGCAMVLPVVAGLFFPLKAIIATTSVGMVSAIIFLVLSPLWIKRSAVAHIMNRPTVGVELSRTGAMMRRAEQTPWSQIAYAVVVLPLVAGIVPGAVASASDIHPLAPLAVYALVGLAFASASILVALKLLQLVRGRHLKRLGHRNGFKSKL